MERPELRERTARGAIDGNEAKPAVAEGGLEVGPDDGYPRPGVLVRGVETLGDGIAERDDVDGIRVAERIAPRFKAGIIVVHATRAGWRNRRVGRQGNQLPGDPVRRTSVGVRRRIRVVDRGALEHGLTGNGGKSGRNVRPDGNGGHAGQIRRAIRHDEPRLAGREISSPIRSPEGDDVAPQADHRAGDWRLRDRHLAAISRNDLAGQIRDGRLAADVRAVGAIGGAGVDDRRGGVTDVEQLGATADLPAGIGQGEGALEIVRAIDRNQGIAGGHRAAR